MSFASPISAARRFWLEFDEATVRLETTGAFHAQVLREPLLEFSDRGRSADGLIVTAITVLPTVR